MEAQPHGNDSLKTIIEFGRSYATKFNLCAYKNYFNYNARIRTILFSITIAY